MPAKKKCFKQARLAVLKIAIGMFIHMIVIDDIKIFLRKNSQRDEREKIVIFKIINKVESDGEFVFVTLFFSLPLFAILMHL